MSASDTYHLPRRTALVAAIVLVTTTIAIACETPVYRFAMYRWEPAAYSVYYLGEGDPSAEHQAVIDRLADLQFGDDADTGEPSTQSVNIDVVAIDTAANDVTALIPPSVHDAWQEFGAALPTFLVAAPGGRLLHTGELSLDDADALVDSPARQTAARLLDVEHVAVFYVLESEDTEANDTARRTIRDVIDLADAGVLVADDPLAGELVTDDAEDVPMLLATVSVSRDDPAERWLVRMLLGIEDDLESFSEPMVFPVFGRGRALEPFIGRGITTDNLAGAVTYVTGSCSCEIKEQNPGMDLLTRWDWETTATALAERIGEEEGNRGLITETELFPTIIVATSDGASRADETTPITDTPADGDEPTETEATLVAVNTETVETDDADADASDTTAPTTDTASTDDAAAEPDSPTDVAEATVEAATDAAEASGSDQFQQRSVRNLMLGGALAIVILVALSLSVVKSRPSV